MEWIMKRWMHGALFVAAAVSAPHVLTAADPVPADGPRIPSYATGTPTNSFTQPYAGIPAYGPGTTPGDSSTPAAPAYGPGSIPSSNPSSWGLNPAGGATTSSLSAPRASLTGQTSGGPQLTSPGYSPGSTNPYASSVYPPSTPVLQTPASGLQPPVSGLQP